MSRIVSPHPPTNILITFDESSGATACTIFDGKTGSTKELPVYQVVAIFAQLITQFLKDAAAAGGFDVNNVKHRKPGENAGGNAGEENKGNSNAS